MCMSFMDGWGDKFEISDRDCRASFLTFEVKFGDGKGALKILF